MAHLIVENIQDDVRERLHERARQHGHSVEDEVCGILEAAVKDDAVPGPERLGSWISQQFASCPLEDGQEIAEWRNQPARPATFE